MSTTANPIEESLAALARTVSETDSGVVPPVPESIEDAGIPEALIEQLILKYLYFRGEMMGRELAQEMGLELEGPTLQPASHEPAITGGSD